MTDGVAIHIVDYPSKNNDGTGRYHLYFQDPLVKKKQGFMTAYGKRRTKEEAYEQILKKEQSIISILKEITEQYQNKIKTVIRMK